MAGGRLWEPDEEAVVRAMGPGPAEVRRVARELGRSESAVRTRKFVLGMSVPDRWSKAEIAELDRMVAGGMAVEGAAVELGRSRAGAYAVRHRERDAGHEVAVAVRGERAYT